MALLEVSGLRTSFAVDEGEFPAVTIQAQIMELMHTLQKESGTAILLITHDLGVVAEVADEVAAMYCGRIVEQAPVATLFALPQHPYTVGLLGSTRDCMASKSGWRPSPAGATATAATHGLQPMCWPGAGAPTGTAISSASTVANSR